MAKAYLGLGANIGDPAAQLLQALAAIETLEDVEITRRSSMLTTKAWGKTDQPDFQNMVIEVETSLSPQKLLEACLSVEQELGRVRIEKWGPRLIDIDIVAYDRLELKSETLNLPHPYAHERDFVLTPLREIAPEIADWLVARSV